MTLNHNIFFTYIHIMPYLIHIFILTTVFAIDLTPVFDAAIRRTIDETCPFHDMKGLSRFCHNHTQSHTKIKTDLPNLLVTLGTGWDPISAEIKLPFFHLTYHKTRLMYRVPESDIASQTRSISYLKISLHTP